LDLNVRHSINSGEIVEIERIKEIVPEIKEIDVLQTGKHSETQVQ
jgi:hypothetical protein